MAIVSVVAIFYTSHLNARYLSLFMAQLTGLDTCFRLPKSTIDCFHGLRTGRLHDVDNCNTIYLRGRGVTDVVLQARTVYGLRI